MFIIHTACPFQGLRRLERILSYVPFQFFVANNLLIAGCFVVVTVPMEKLFVLDRIISTEGSSDYVVYFPVISIFKEQSSGQVPAYRLTFPASPV